MTNYKKLKIIILTFVAFCSTAIAHEHEKSISFIENKGQWEDFICYKSELKGGSVFFEKNIVTFNFIDNDYLEKLGAIKTGNTNIILDSLATFYAYKISFLNANPDNKISAKHPFEEYLNYYIGNDPSRWQSHVQKYAEIEYENIYDGINIKYYEQYNTYKYDVIVQPHADIASFKMKYEGADKIYLKGKTLNIHIGKFSICELRPYAYQIDDNNNIQKIDCDFVVENNIVSFKIGAYDHNKTLIIDPTIVFASYSGSTADNFGFTATYDAHGNTYGGGSVFSIGYPTTTGAYQTAYIGNTDIGITKFNAYGTARVFSTYLGGSSCDTPHSLFVNNNDELYVLTSTSSINFPTTAGCYQSMFKGGTSYYSTGNGFNYTNGVDVAISRFNSSGTALLSSTFFGGSGNDGLNINLLFNYADQVRGDLQVDNLGNVYIASSTLSTNLPVTTGAFQTIPGGNQDGFVAKFSGNLRNLIYCSYIGGSSSDAVYNLELDQAGNIYICGGTISTDFPTKSGAYQTNFNGVVDGFVAKISTTGTQLMHSTYIGTAAYDQTFMVKLDKDENVYIMGQSCDSASSWTYNVNWSSGAGQYVMKLNNNLTQRIWSTAFGSSNLKSDIAPTAMMVDICGNIHISGWGGSTNMYASNHSYINTTMGGLPITSDAFKSVPNSYGNFYFISLEKDASNLLFATYYGGSASNGEHVDGGTSRFDKKGTIYQAICAGCRGLNSFPITNGVIGPTNNSSNCNMAVLKISFDLSTILADFSMPSIICAPLSIYFNNTSHVNDSTIASYYWDFGDGTHSTQAQPQHFYSQSGTYNIQLIVIDSSSCNIADTLTKTLTVLSNTTDTLPTITLCKGDHAQIGITPSADTNLTFLWVPSVGLNDSNIANPYFIDTTSRVYHLIISNGICNDTLVQEVKVVSLPAAKRYINYCCYTDSIQASADTTDAIFFHWSSNNSFTDTLNSSLSDPKAILKPKIRVAHYYLRRSNGTCSAIDTFTVYTSSYRGHLDSIDPICANTSIRINLNIDYQQFSTLYNTVWKADYGSISVGQGGSYIDFTSDTSTYLSVISSNEFGCYFTDTIYIDVIKLYHSTIISPIKCYQDSSGTLEVLVTGGTEPYIYQWVHDSTIDTNYISNLTAGNYQLIVKDSNQCKDTITIGMTQPSPIQVSLYDTNSITDCGAECHGKVSLNITGGTAPYYPQWTSGSTSTTLTDLCSGIYQCIISDSNNCQDTVIFEVTDTSLMTVTYELTEPTCYADCNGSIKINVQGAFMPYTVLWSNTSTEDKIDYLCSDYYNVLITDAQHCKRHMTIFLPEPEELGLSNYLLLPPKCKGESNASISVNAKGGTPPYRYFWNNVEGDNTLSQIPAGTYHLSIRDSNDCEFDTTFVVNDYEYISATYTATKVPCEEICNASATIFAHGGCPPYSYHWSNGDSLSTAYHLCYGSQSVTVLDSNGCNINIQIMIEDSSSFNDSIHVWADTTTFYRTIGTYLHVTDLGNEFTYSWSPRAYVDPIMGVKVHANPDDTTTFIVIVTDKYGCQKSDTITLYVLDVFCDEPLVFVPNAFSPNGDGLNDVLYVRGDILVDIEFAVYDRWGEKVFETKDKTIGWDGTFRNKMCEPGVYVYYLQATCISGIKNIIKGNVTLIR